MTAVGASSCMRAIELTRHWSQSSPLKAPRSSRGMSTEGHADLVRDTNLNPRSKLSFSKAGNHWLHENHRKEQWSFLN